MLQEIEEFGLVHLEDYAALLSSWEKKNYVFSNSFQYIEPILSQRVVMFGIRDSIKSNSAIKNGVKNVQIKIAAIGREQGHLNVAARALGK